MIVNLTPHSISVVSLDGNTHVFPSSGVARVSVQRIEALPVDGFAVHGQAFGAVEGLPQPVAGTTYVVSAIVLSALAGARGDVVGPDTGPTAIRENGQVVAVRGFVR